LDRTRCGHRLLVAVLVSTLAGLGLHGRPAAAAQSSVAADLLALVNGDRAAAGLAPLAWNARLAAVGESAPYSGCGFTVHGRAEDMVERDYFAHPILGCGGRNVFAMLGAEGVGYSMAGENIGWMAGGGDPAAQAAWLHQQFMASPEHRANILRPGFTAIGIGSWTTAPAQAWTGGGAPESNVLVVAEEFAAFPAAPRAAAAAPAHDAPAPLAPAAAPVAPPPQAASPRPALPETGVLGPAGG
jgi:uncharacterized protein YkwD